MNKTKDNKLKHYVDNDIQEMINVLKNTEEDTIRWNPSKEEWSIMQVVVHVSESIPFWLNEIERVKKDPTVKWGRGYFDKNRLITLSKENIDNTTLDEAITNLEKVPLLVKETLESLTDEQPQEKAIQFMIDIEVIKHIEGHLHQVKRNLSNKEKAAWNLI